MGKLKKTDVENWLKNVREAAKKPGFNHQNYFLVETHAYECACRSFTERKIVDLITSLPSKPVIKENMDKKAKPDSYKIIVTDTDPLISDRKKCELVLLAPCLKDPKPTQSPPLPLIISAWREGSPHPEDPNAPPCKSNPHNPPCKLKKHRRPKMHF